MSQTRHKSWNKWIASILPSVLKNGWMTKAKENVAAMLFSLYVVHDNKKIMNKLENVECMHSLLFESAIKQAKWLVEGTQPIIMY
jgi:hypothetical protein